MLKVYLDMDNPGILEKLEKLRNHNKDLEYNMVKLANDLAHHVQESIIHEAPYSTRDDPRKRTARKHLKENILVKDDSPLNYRVYVNRLVYYAPYVEFGTRAHTIQPRDKRALYWPEAEHPVRSVQHPGTRPNPFFSRGIQYAKPEINRRLNEFEARVDEILLGG